MKLMIKVSSVIVLLIMVVSCATTEHALPEKYNLDNYLEEVNRISTFRVSDLENIDNQSVILRASLKAIRNEYYLLVLRRPIETTHSHEYISIENTAAKDREYSAQRILSEIRDSSRGLSQPGTAFRQAPSNIAGIRAGFDRIVVKEWVDDQYYVIEKIYKLEGKEQAEEIKEQLRKS